MHHVSAPSALLPRQSDVQAHWAAPVALKPLNATVTVPGSKSLTNRYYVLAALAQGPSRIRNALRSRDTDLMLDALRTLGAHVRIEGDDVLITPIPFDAPIGEQKVDCGLAGTVMRFATVLAAFAQGEVIFDGDPAARERPMAPVLDALDALGVSVKAARAGDDTEIPRYLPYRVVGKGSVRGGTITVDSAASSQFVSALLLCAPRMTAGLDLRVGGKVPSPEHIEMTVHLLRERGVDVTEPEPGRWIVPAAPIESMDVLVEPDLSNAGPFLAAALVAGGTVRVRHWPQTSTQIGRRWPEILTAMGASADIEGDVLSVTANGEITAARFEDLGELAPTVAALCALAQQGHSELTGIAHLRGHETNRLAALTTELNSLGGNVQERDDGLDIGAQPLHGGVFHTYHDHRLATAAALIGLAVPEVLVENVQTTSKTMPEFTQLWEQMLAGDRH